MNTLWIPRYQPLGPIIIQYRVIDYKLIMCHEVLWKLSSLIFIQLNAQLDCSKEMF